MANDIQRMLDENRRRAEEKARQRAPKPVPAANGSTYTPLAGPGPTPEDNNIGTRLGGINTYRAGFPGYNNEAGFNDRQMSVQARGQQKELGDAITDRALGRGGLSVAELQLNRGMNQAQQRIAQQAAGARGMSRAGAQSAALRGASDLYSNTNEQAGIMRAQEQIAAQQLATQNVRDMRQQDLLSRGYSIEEAKAILDAQMRAQEINAGITTANAKNAQGATMLGVAALGGLLASDERAKEIMYSDFTMKEGPGLRPEPARVDALAPTPPEPPVRAAGGFQPMLSVTPTKELDDSVEEQQRSLGEQAIAAAAGGGGGDLGSQAQTGFNIGSALGGALGGLSDFRSKEMLKVRPSSGKTFDMSPERINRMGDHIIREKRQERKISDDRAKAFGRLKYIREGEPAMDRAREASRDYYAMQSDFRGKEVTTGDLDNVAREAMLPFEEMNAAESREALGPVDSVVYRYKEGPSERMAREQSEMADLRSRYAGMGAITSDEAQAIEQGTFKDKRTPRLGIVAQDLQQSPAFRQSVVSTPAGLAVQRDRALSTALGAVAGLDKRMKQIEKDRSLMNDLEDMGDAKSDEIRGDAPGTERRNRARREGRIPRATGKQAAEMARMRRIYQAATAP